MADDQITIDPDFGPQREDSGLGQRRSSRRLGLAAILFLLLLFGWLLTSTTSDAPQPIWDPLTVTTVIAQDAPPPPTVPIESPFLVDIGVWGGFETPNDLVIDASGVLFVSETAGERVRTATIQTSLHASEWTIVASGVPDAEGLAVSDDGVLFISGDNTVYSVRDGGAAVRFAHGFDDPEGLAIDANGDLYVADDADGGIRISKVAIRPDGTGELPVWIATVPGHSAADIEFGPNGDLFVANARDGVWAIKFRDDGSASSRLFASLMGQRALAFDESGTLYSAGGGDFTVWSIDEQGVPTAIGGQYFQVEGLAVAPSGILYISSAADNEILRIDPASIDASGANAASDATPPDLVGALPGDEGRARQPLGMVDELPSSLRLDFLYELCVPECTRDAVASDEPFHVRHGFINNGTESLGDDFDVVMYLTRRSGPVLSDGGFELGQTYRFTSDFVLRGTTDECGPTYRTQSEPQNCEWFVHDFPDGIPAGRYDLWAVWEAPCSAWMELGFTESCSQADEVVSFFSSGVNSPFGWE